MLQFSKEIATALSTYEANFDSTLHLVNTLQCAGFCLQWRQRIGASLGNYSNEEITVFFIFLLCHALQICVL